jgi:hypothetical protein
MWSQIWGTSIEPQGNRATTESLPVAAGQGRQIRQCRPRNLFEKNTI